MRSALLASAAVAQMLLATGAGAQAIAERVSAVRDGAVTFHFAARPGVCGDGSHYVRLGHSTFGSYGGRYMGTCEQGPVEVRLTQREGKTERVESWVGAPRDRQAHDLGAVPSAEAARFLTDLARTGDADASVGAIIPAVLADSAVVWPALLAVVRDERTRSQHVRKDAAFWLSRFAASASAGRPNELDDDEHADDLKSHAVFVLSQLPREEAVPALLDVARSNSDRHVRSQALFWLGQTGDRRALDLFESLLR